MKPSGTNRQSEYTGLARKYSKTRQVSNYDWYPPGFRIEITSGPAIRPAWIKAPIHLRRYVPIRKAIAEAGTHIRPKSSEWTALFMYTDLSGFMLREGFIGETIRAGLTFGFPDERTAFAWAKQQYPSLVHRKYSTPAAPNLVGVWERAGKTFEQTFVNLDHKEERRR